MALKKVGFGPNIDMNEVFFLSLLRSSLSLKTADKSRILHSMKDLSQFQVDELALVFIEERKQFTELADSEKECIQSLLNTAVEQWDIIEQSFDIPELLNEQELLEEVNVFLAYYTATHATLPDWLYKYNQKNQEEPNHHEDFSVQLDFEEENHDSLPKWLSEHIDMDDEEDDEAHHELLIEDFDEETEEEQHQLFGLLSKIEREQEFSEKTERLNPIQIIEKLKQMVLGQDDALKKMATILFYHYQSYLVWETRYQTNQEPTKSEEQPLYLRQPPTLFIGKTGTGKTHLIKSVIQFFNLNFVVINSSTLVRTGIVGTSIDTIGKMIFEGAGKDIAKAEFSVVFFDEFDKLFMQNTTSYESYTNLSIALQLLMIMEGSAPFPVEHNQRERDDYPTHIDSTKMLFILGGSFGLHEKNLRKMAMGFHDKQPQKPLHDFNQLYLTDLGLPDELSGRIGQIICLNPINKSFLKEILLNSPNSPWKVLANQIQLMGCEIVLPDEVIERLIDDNQKEIDKFGVRGLYQAFNRLPCIYDFMIQATLESGQTFYMHLPETETSR